MSFLIEIGKQKETIYKDKNNKGYKQGKLMY